MSRLKKHLKAANLLGADCTDLDGVFDMFHYYINLNKKLLQEM